MEYVAERISILEFYELHKKHGLSLASAEKALEEKPDIHITFSK